MSRRALALCCLLAGCAGGGQPAPDFSLTSGRSAPSRSADVAVHTDLIRGMLAQDNNYAALAHIQDQQRRSGNSIELKYLEAEARRRLGEAAAAEALYRSLLRTEVAAQAYHGLGLLYASRDMAKSVNFLREAAHRQPTDAELRSDLGYALLRAGRYRESLPELATAVELDSANERARNNLILLLLATGDEPGVKRVVADTGVDAKTLTRLRKQAQSMQGRAAANGGAR